MASRYWVGGTATWDGTTTANWSATSGGASGASVPTSADDVFIDANSGTGTITTSSSTQSPCRNIDCTGYTGTLVVPGIWAINGSLTYSSGMTLSGAGTIGMNATSTNGGGGWVVTSNGKAFTGNISFNGIGGKWVLADSLALTSGQLAINGGELDTQGFSVTTGQLISSATNVKTFTPRSSSISLVQGFTTVWNISGSNMTVTANTATVTNTLISSSWSDTQGVNWNGLSVNFSGGNTSIFTGVAGTTLGNLTRSTTGSTDVTTFAGPFTITGTLTLSGSNNTSNRHLAQSSVLGTARTITAAVVSLTNVDFIDIAGAGAAAPFTGTSLGDALGNSGITFPASVTRYAVNSGNWSNTTMWSATSGGASGASVPLPQDDAVFDANSAAGTYTVNMLRACRNLDCTNFTRTLAASGTPISYGNFTLGAGMTITGFWAWGGRGSHTITSAGKQPNSRVLATPTGTYTLQDAMTMVASAQIQHQSGTFVTNNFNVSCDIYAPTATGTRACTLGTSTVTVLNGTSPWSATSITMSAASSTIVIGNAGASTRTFIGAGQTYGTLTYTVANSSGTLVITGANTFNTINIGVGRTLTVPSSTTTTVTNMNMAGNGVNILRDAGFESGTNNILTATGGDTGAIITATPTPLAGTYAYRVTKGAASADYYNQGYLNYTFPGATQFTVSVWIYSSVAIANAFLATDASYTGSTIAAGGFDANSGPAVAVSANTWTQLTLTITPSVGDLTGTLIVRSALPMASGNTIVHDSWQIETGATATTNTGGTRATLNSSTSGVAATLSKSSGYIAGDYLLVQNIAFTGGGTFYAGSRSLDFGGNTGVSFTNAPQRYWVGGTGTWDASTTTNWAVISGGTGGITVPTSIDDVKFDANSGTGLVSVTVTAPMQNFDTTGFTGSFSVSNTLLVTGNIVLGTATTTTGLVLTHQVAASTTKTITSNGKTISFLFMSNSTSSGTTSLSDALVVSNTLQLSSGVFNTAGFSVTCAGFNSNNGSVRTLTLGSTNMTITSGGTCWNTGLTTNLTITANTAAITCSGNTLTFSSGAVNFNGMSVAFTGVNSVNLAPGTGSTGLVNVTRIGTAVKTDSLTISHDVTLSGTLTLTGNSVANRILVQSSVAGTARTITAAAVSLSNVDFTDIVGAGAAAPFTGTSLGDALGNSGITFTTAATQTWQTTGAGSWSDATKWTSRVPLPQDDVVISSAFVGAPTITIDMPRVGKSIDMTGTTGLQNFTVATGVTSYGSITLAGLVQFSGTNQWTLAGRGSHTIRSNGIVWSAVRPFFAAPGSTYTLQDALTATDSMTITAGTFVTGSFALSIRNFVATFTSPVTTAVTFGTSTVTLTAVAQVSSPWSVSAGVTVSAASSTVVLSAAATASRSFVGAGSTYGTVTYTVANSPGSLVITGANTFGTLNIGSGRTLTLPSSTTTTVTNLNIAGKTTVVDTFTRADSSTTMGTTETGGLTWTPLSGTAWGITSNQAQAVLNIGQQVTVVDAASIDVDVSVTMTALGDAGIVVRATDDNNYWMLIRTAGGTLNLYQRNAGTFSSKATASPTFGSSAVFRLTAIGDVYTGYLDGVQQFTFTDSFNNTATKVGLRDNSNTARFDNFSVIALSRVISSSAGTAATLSKSSGYIAGDYLYVKDITFTGGGTFYAGSRSANVSNNTGVTFTDAPQRYWVGGTALWDNAANQKWAVVSGGTGGIALPTASTDVFFDANSGTGTVTVWAANVTCRSLICTGYTGTLATGSIASGIVIGDASGGALTFSSGMTVNMTTFVGTVSFVSTSNNGGSGWPITSAGKTLPNVTFNGVGGKWVLADALSASGALAATRGTLDTANFSLAATSFTQGGGNVFTLTPGSSTMTFSGAWSNDGSLAVSTNTATAVFNGASGTFTQAQASTYNGLSVSFTGSGQSTLTTQAGTAFTNVTRIGTASKSDVFRVTNDFTVTGTLTVTGNSVTNRMLLFSNTIGTVRTITAAAVSFINVDFMDIAAAGAAIPWTGTSLGDALGNSNITFTTPTTRYGVAAGSWSNTAVWSTTSGGASGASVPLPQDDVFLDANMPAGTISLDMPRLGRNIDCTGLTRVVGGAGVSNTIYGSLTLSSTMSWGLNSSFILGGRGTHTFTTAGKTFAQTLQVGVVSAGTYTLQDAITSVVNQLNAYNLVTNNFSVTTASLLLSGACNFGTSTTSVTTAATGVQMILNSASTLSNASFAYTTASAVSRTVAGTNASVGTLTYTVANSPGTLAITGTNTFSTLNVGPGRTLTLPSSTTTVVNNWNVAGQNNGYLYTSSGTATAPHSAAIGLTGDIDIRVKLAADNYATTAALFYKQSSWWLYTTTGGAFQLVYSTDGSNQIFANASNPHGLAAGAVKWVRVTRIAATGAVNYYVSDDGSAWTSLSSVSTAASSIFNTANGITISPGGKVYRAQLLSGVGGAVVFDADFTTKPFGADTFTESSSNAATVTLSGAAVVGDGRVAVNSSTSGTQATLVADTNQITSSYLTVKDVAAGTAPAWNVSNLLSGDDSTFESSLGGWIANTNCSISRSTVAARDGVGSLLMSPTGAVTKASNNSVKIPITVGTLYVLSGYSKAVTAAATTQVYVYFWNSTPTFLLDGPGGSVVDNTSTWTRMFAAFIPSGTQAYASPGLTGASMVTGQNHYFDSLALAAATPAYAGRTSVDKGNNTNWLFVDLINAQNIPLQSTSTLTAGPLVTEPGAATLASTSTLTTQLIYVAKGAATMASTSTLAVQAAVATTAAVQLQATSTLTTTPQVTVQAFASFLSTSTLLASASLGKFVTVDLTSSSVLVAQAIITKFLSVTLLSSSIASVGGIVTTLGFVNLRSISISTTMPTFYLNMTWTPGSLVSGFKATMDESWKMSLC